MSYRDPHQFEPRETFRYENVEATIWENEEGAAEPFTVKIARVRWESDEWKHSSFFAPDDLPHLSKTVAAVSAWLAGQKQKAQAVTAPPPTIKANTNRYQNLIHLWDELEDRIRKLKWIQSALVDPKLKKMISGLEAACRFDIAQKYILRDWRKFAAQKSARDIVAILAKYAAEDRTLDEFFYELCDAKGQVQDKAASITDTLQLN